MPSDNEQKVEFRVARYGEHFAIAKVHICEVCGEYKGEVYSPKTGGITRVSACARGVSAPGARREGYSGAGRR